MINKKYFKKRLATNPACWSSFWYSKVFRFSKIDYGCFKAVKLVKNVLTRRSTFSDLEVVVVVVVEVWFIKPGPSTNMLLPIFKMYHNNPPKMGWPLKTRSRTGKMEKNINFSEEILKFAQLMYCNIGFWHTTLLLGYAMFCYKVLCKLST